MARWRLAAPPPTPPPLPLFLAAAASRPSNAPAAAPGQGLLRGDPRAHCRSARPGRRHGDPRWQRCECRNCDKGGRAPALSPPLSFRAGRRGAPRARPLTPCLSLTPPPMPSPAAAAQRARPRGGRTTTRPRSSPPKPRRPRPRRSTVAAPCEPAKRPGGLRLRARRFSPNPLGTNRALTHRSAPPALPPCACRLAALPGLEQLARLTEHVTFLEKKSITKDAAKA